MRSPQHLLCGCATILKAGARQIRERRLARLSDDEKRLFALICRSYLAAMMPDFEYRKTVVTMQVPVQGAKAAEFRATGRIPLVEGWTAVYGSGDRKPAGRRNRR